MHTSFGFSVNAEGQNFCVSFDGYMDILHCTFRVHTVICTECVGKGKVLLVQGKCRRPREMEKKDTSDCLKVDVWIMVMHCTYSDGYGICTFIHFEFVHFALGRDIMLMHHTYSV